MEGHKWLEEMSYFHWLRELWEISKTYRRVNRCIPWISAVCIEEPEFRFHIFAVEAEKCFELCFPFYLLWRTICKKEIFSMLQVEVFKTHLFSQRNFPVISGMLLKLIQFFYILFLHNLIIQIILNWSLICGILLSEAASLFVDLLCTVVDSQKVFVDSGLKDCLVSALVLVRLCSVRCVMTQFF